MRNKRERWRLRVDSSLKRMKQGSIRVSWEDLLALGRRAGSSHDPLG